MNREWIGPALIVAGLAAVWQLGGWMWLVIALAVMAVAVVCPPHGSRA